MDVADQPKARHGCDDWPGDSKKESPPNQRVLELLQCVESKAASLRTQRDSLFQARSRWAFAPIGVSWETTTLPHIDCSTPRSAGGVIDARGSELASRAPVVPEFKSAAKRPSVAFRKGRCADNLAKTKAQERRLAVAREQAVKSAIEVSRLESLQLGKQREYEKAVACADARRVAAEEELQRLEDVRRKDEHDHRCSEETFDKECVQYLAALETKLSGARAKANHFASEARHLAVEHRSDVAFRIVTLREEYALRAEALDHDAEATEQAVMVGAEAAILDKLDMQEGVKKAWQDSRDQADEIRLEVQMVVDRVDVERVQVASCVNTEVKQLEEALRIALLESAEREQALLQFDTPAGQRALERALEAKDSAKKRQQARDTIGRDCKNSIDKAIADAIAAGERASLRTQAAAELADLQAAALEQEMSRFTHGRHEVYILSLQTRLREDIEESRGVLEKHFQGFEAATERDAAEMFRAMVAAREEVGDVREASGLQLSNKARIVRERLQQTREDQYVLQQETREKLLQTQEKMVEYGRSMQAELAKLLAAPPLELG